MRSTARITTQSKVYLNVFTPPGMHFGAGQPQDPKRFLKKRRLFRLRFRQGDGYLRTA